jgi:hypothetical protein
VFIKIDEKFHDLNEEAEDHVQLCWDTGPIEWPRISKSDWPGQFVSWCRTCRKWNKHGRSEGHRSAHCNCGSYWLRLVGPIDGHIAQDLNRKKPIGPTFDNVANPRNFRVLVKRRMRFAGLEHERGSIISVPLKDALNCVASTRCIEVDILPQWARRDEPLLPGKLWIAPVTVEMTSTSQRVT